MIHTHLVQTLKKPYTDILTHKQMHSPLHTRTHTVHAHAPTLTHPHTPSYSTFLHRRHSPHVFLLGVSLIILYFNTELSFIKLSAFASSTYTGARNTIPAQLGYLFLSIFIPPHSVEMHHIKHPGQPFFLICLLFSVT